MATFVDTRFQMGNGKVILYAIVLSIFGVAIVLLTCFFAAIQPRCALPMMELLMFSVMILLGAIFHGVQKFLDKPRWNPAFHAPS
jgi:hypothetical protein